MNIKTEYISKINFDGKINQIKGRNIKYTPDFDYDRFTSKNKKHPSLIKKIGASIASVFAITGIVSGAINSASNVKKEENKEPLTTSNIGTEIPKMTGVLDIKEETTTTEPEIIPEEIIEEKEKLFIQHEKYGTSVDKELAIQIDEKAGYGFCAKVEEIAKELKCNPNDLLAMFYSESGINPKAGYGGDGTVGIAQFDNNVAKKHNMTKDELAMLSGVEQLDIVKENLMLWKNFHGISDEKINGETLYALNFLPAYAMDEDYLCAIGSDFYEWNKGADLNKDNYITKKEMGEILKRKFSEMVNEFLPDYNG